MSSLAFHHTPHGFITLLHRFVAPVVAGVFLMLSFAPWHMWYMAFVGIALLVRSLRGASYSGSVWRGFLTGLSFFLPLTSWSYDATGARIAHLGLACALSLYLAALCAIWQFLMRRLNFVAGLAPSLGIVWAAFEQLRSSWPYGGMPWGTLAFGQVEGPLIAIAPYGSTSFIALVIVVCGVLIESFFSSRTLISRLGLVISLGTFIFAPIALPIGSEADSYITVGFVQGNVPRAHDTGEERALLVTRNHAEETKKLYNSGAELVLWPESASDMDPDENIRARNIIEDTLEHLGVPLMLGTQRYPGNVRYNDYTLWLPGQGKVARYSKQHPVPFGEYMPQRDFFRRFTSAVDIVGRDMAAGTSPALLEVPIGERTIKVATPICFEVAYTHIVTEAVGHGAELIVVPTNNASFGDSSESLQQFDMSRFRAVETGRTVVQVSTMGVSGVVSPNGVTRDLTQMWTADHKVIKVALNSEQTFATRFASQISCGFTVAAGVVLLLAWVGKIVLGRK